MLRLISEVTGYHLLAQDGEIGRCQDFLFDDRDWVVRYMVANTSRWLPGRKVVLSPVLLDQPDWSAKRLPVRLDREQIKDSPALAEHQPVSRQYEENYHRFYALPYYWFGQDLWGAYTHPGSVVYPIPEPTPQTLEELPAKEGHLRSIEEVAGYHIASRDGEVGHIEDFLLDDFDWCLRYVVIDTRNWLPGRKVLISPEWIDSVRWTERQVHVDLTSESIKASPEFDPSTPINRQYEERLYDHYGRPHYWR